jgi:hypothetical protein
MLATSLSSRNAALSVESLKALDWLNFFLAALLMGFGPFIAVHLVENGWAPESIGAVLTISGLAGLTTEVDPMLRTTGSGFLGGTAAVRSSQ